MDTISVLWHLGGASIGLVFLLCGARTHSMSCAGSIYRRVVGLRTHHLTSPCYWRGIEAISVARWCNEKPCSRIARR